MKTPLFFSICLALSGGLILTSWLEADPAPSASPAPGVNSAAIPQSKVGKTGNWMAAHQKLVARVQTDQCDVLFVGDSITEHWLTDGRGKDVWAARYQPIKAINIGKAGDRTENVLWRLQHGGLGKVHPKVIVLLIGVNNLPTNTPPQIVDGIAAIVKELRTDLPEAKILLLAIFPKGKPGDPDRAKISEINRGIAQFDDGRSIFFLDLGPTFLNHDGAIKDGVLVDGLHPSTKGYEIWADAMAPKLKELLASPAPAAK